MKLRASMYIMVDSFITTDLTSKTNSTNKACGSGNEMINTFAFFNFRRRMNRLII